MISFVIPAHNEEAWIGRCVSTIRGAMELVGGSYEMIVVDDASSDGTASVARENGARVIRVEHRQISATRNAGAREASGEILFFVDADTLVTAHVIQSALQSIRQGAVGGGCVPIFEGWLPLWCRIVFPTAELLVRWARLPGGACQFCTQNAFQTAKGFSEKHYAAEDAFFVLALKKQGRFVVLPEPVITSGRKLREHSLWSIACLMSQLALQGRNAFRSRRGLDVWYEAKREEPAAVKKPDVRR